MRETHRVRCNRCTSRPNGRGRRAGGIYIAVLMAVLVITMIGLSAVLAARIERRSSTADDDAVRARFFAQSFAEVVVQRLNTDATWRTRYTNAAWSIDEKMDGGTVAFRLIDEADADLADDSSEAFRIQARASCGKATRGISFVVQPPSFGSGGTPPEKIDNSGMESVTASTSPPNRWYHFPAGTADAPTAWPNSGLSMGRVSGRTVSGSGLSQNLATSMLRKGATYNVSAWVRYGGAVQARAGLILTDSSGATTKFQVFKNTINNDWVRASGTITPTWTGSLVSARFHVETTSGLLELRVDDCSLTEQAGTGSLSVVAGTVRRELAN